MENVGMLLIAAIIAVGLVMGARALQRYWDEETNMSEEDHAFDRRMASYNDQVTSKRRDDEIVRILGGQDLPTIADRYRQQEQAAEDEDDDDYDDEDEDDDDEFDVGDAYVDSRRRQRR